MRVIFFHFFPARPDSPKVTVMRALTVTVLLAAAQAAAAQVGLPAVRLPNLPAVNVPGSVAPDLLSGNASPADLDAQARRELRQTRIRELLRRHADVLERDPHGDPIVRGQVLVLSPNDVALQAAAAAGFTEPRELALAPLGIRIVLLHTSGNTERALKALEKQDPSGTYDFNHIYLDSGMAPRPEDGAQPPPGAAVAAPPAPAPAGPAAATVRVGLIDSGVDAEHAAFRGAAVHRHGCAGALVPDSHGTAVASLLVGEDGPFRGAVPGAELYAADVFCGVATGGGVDTVAEAFAWLVGERVPVINVSLVGPPNNLLRAVVASVIARGYLVVAAVGNDGPAAPPLYPAAWPGVVGVTAVDARGHVLPEAERGPQVKFAAPGADMAAARSPQGYGLVRGTSFAAPLVAGLLALRLTAPDESAARSALADLAARADAHGAHAQGPVYGYGLVGADLRIQPALVHVRAD
jgi:subtilisin family serine protease